jgi:hypothetical protein
MPRNATESKQASPTMYVVLEQVTTVSDVLGDILGTGRANYVVWAPVLNAIATQGPDGHPRLFEAASKSAAIRQHTGTGEDVKPGTWKAIPWSSWKGGETTRTKVTAERLPFEEGDAA